MAEHAQPELRLAYVSVTHSPMSIRRRSARRLTDRSPVRAFLLPGSGVDCLAAWPRDILTCDATPIAAAFDGPMRCATELRLCFVTVLLFRHRTAISAMSGFYPEPARALRLVLT